MKDNKIIIFDTTLRDGEQSPGASMNTEEKIQIALQLQKLGVDVIEAGFAAASPGDFDAIARIAEAVTKSRICSLARALDRDIKAAGEAVSKAKMSRIHTFIATSPIHMEYKLKMTPDQVIKKAVEAVQYAKTFCDDVEFSCEDAGRSDVSFMKEVLDAVINAGATTLNIPDTVGYRLPTEMGAIIKSLHEFVGDRAIISVHNHNDLGLAVANSLACIENGARQVECTINGLGERAGNAALEEIVMALRTRKDHFNGYETNINIKEIYPTSKLVSSITGIEPQPNKAIVGKNAFSHESGIHQDGVLKHTETYEIMSAKDIGLDKNSIVLGKHSGRHAFKSSITKFLKAELNEADFEKIFEKFLELADRKKEIYNYDLYHLAEAFYMEQGKQAGPMQGKLYELVNSQVVSNDIFPSASVKIKQGEKVFSDSAVGDGPIDALYTAIKNIVNVDIELLEYRITSTSKGKEALGRVNLQLKHNGKIYPAKAVDTDIIRASAMAFLNGVNDIIIEKFI